MKVLLIAILSLLSLTNFVSGEIRITLNSGNFSGVWTVHNDSSSEKIEAHVPGGIYSDLNLAQDLFYRQNDHEFRWVGYENWTYETTFELSEEILNKTAINLVFYGIDTVGEIWLNGQFMQTVNNMFVRYVVPIKDSAMASNILEVRLKSPVLAAQELSAASEYDVPPNCPGPDQHGECHINFLRKMQSSFSWDWGLAAPSVGIWKSVEIEAFNTAVIRDVVATLKLVENGTKWIIEAVSYFEGATEDDSSWGNWQYVLGIYAPNFTEPIVSVKNLRKNLNQTKNFAINGTFELYTVNSLSWWPNGYGSQPLYTVKCHFNTFNKFDNEESEKSSKFGLRSVELVQEEIQPGKDGLTFYFKVNEVPMFAKGANWIPGHILPELGYDERMLRRTLQSAKDAHMNMLRVWGGGVYESDLFYDICDELGIMIWQDMMFAVALYPTNEEFLQSVSMEVDQNIKRLLSHPSIAIWAGNNENEAALTGNWFSINDTEKYYQDYLKLYVDSIKPVVEEKDDSRSYVISSPSNGLKTVEDGGISQNPSNPLWGDMHYYNYDNDPRNTSLYVTPRFASEYGFQAMPSFKSISQVSLPEDWNLGSEFTIFRQHHPNGYAEMTKLMKYFLPLPDDDGSVEFYKTFIYYSQISQAISTKTESEKYRTDRTKLTAENEGQTMGALYWQLNDVWHAPTWSSIEFGGRWKMLHYYAVKFFAPLIVVPDLQPNGEVRVSVISDLLEDVPCYFAFAIFSWDSFDPIVLNIRLVHVANSTTTTVDNINIKDIFQYNNCSVTTCFMYFLLSRENVFAENFYYPSSFSDVTNLIPANITVSATKDENSNDIVVDLVTDRIAPFVWLETDVEGIFSDNGFTLIRKTIQLKFSNRGEEIDFDKFIDSLVVRSLLG